MFTKKALAASVSAAPAVYVEDVFSTWLYTGTGSTQTITNGIDLAGEGGLVWIKKRSESSDHCLHDTERGIGNRLVSNATSSQLFSNEFVSSVSSAGFVIGTPSFNPTADYGQSGETYASWTFRKAAKFFDVVTYTGDGVSDRLILHSLGSTPGCIIVKRLTASGYAPDDAWGVYHRSLGVYNAPGDATNNLFLNTTAAASSSGLFRENGITSTTFEVSADPVVNASGVSYVAYLFAHDAGGFGDAGDQSVVSCGSYTGTSTVGNFVDLGWEPQWVMIKGADIARGWVMADVMRGALVGSNGQRLFANTSDAEVTNDTVFEPTATGFRIRSASSGDVNDSGLNYIYIAIRRGPMKTPTSGTEVFGLNARTGTGANATVTGSAGVSDAVLIKNRGSAVASLFSSRLTGTGYLVTSTTAAEVAAGTTILQANPWDVMDGVKVGTTSTITNASGSTFINYFFRRAPGFFDAVVYTGTGSSMTISHNLGVTPQLIIAKRRSTTGSWDVSAFLSGFTDGVASGYLNGDNNFAQGNGNSFFDPVSSTTFTQNPSVSATTYSAYLFASLTGVSKVGSYTGTGTTLNIDCGFTNGARFVLIKRTDSTGDWYVWDTARGIISGDDPYLLLNSTAAEVTNTDYIDPLSSGFQISSTAPAAINASGGSFIFLAIA
jgi:hypothetical protein